MYTSDDRFDEEILRFFAKNDLAMTPLYLLDHIRKLMASRDISLDRTLSEELRGRLIRIDKLTLALPNFWGTAEDTAGDGIG